MKNNQQSKFGKINSKNIEVELKFEIKRKEISKYSYYFESLGFSNKGRQFEMNIMYDNPQQLMQNTDGRIRIRTKENKTIFTYKKPLTRKGIKKEIEYEVEVSDFKQLEKILKCMNFNPTTSYERYRTTLIKDKVHIMIDEFPYSTFIEIEGEESTIKDLAQKAGLRLNDNLTKSCDTIYTERCISLNLTPSKHILFKDCILSPT